MKMPELVRRSKNIMRPDRWRRGISNPPRRMGHLLSPTIARDMPGESTSDCASGTAILRALQCVVRRGLTCTEFTLQHANGTAIHRYLQSFLESRLSSDEDTIWEELKKNPKNRI